MTTDAQGQYQRWVDELGSPFTVTASAPEHSAAIANGVVVAGGITSTLDLDLVWLRSCTAVSPEGIDEAVKFGRQLTTDLQVSNYGHLETPYYWREYPGSGGQAADLDWLSVEPVSGTIPIGPGFVGAAVRLDAGAPSITQTGVYSAWLVLENEDPIKGGIPIAVKMTVLPLEYGVELTSPITAANGIPGEALSYTLSITNSSEGLTDTIHLSLEGGSWAVPTATSYGPLASGEELSIPLVVVIPETGMPGDLDHLTVTASSQGDPAKSAAITITTTVVAPSADLDLALSAVPDPYPAGVPITFTVEISNLGPTSASGVLFMALLSPRLQYLSDSGGCTRDRTILNCELGWMVPGESRVLTFTGAPIQTGILLNQGAVVSQVHDPFMQNNFAALQGIVEGYIFYFPLYLKK